MAREETEKDERARANDDSGRQRKEERATNLVTVTLLRST